MQFPSTYAFISIVSERITCCELLHLLKLIPKINPTSPSTTLPLLMLTEVCIMYKSNQAVQLMAGDSHTNKHIVMCMKVQGTIFLICISMHVIAYYFQTLQQVLSCFTPKEEILL